MLSGDNGILQKSTEAKRTTERAEAKEQAQMDIMAYIADKTANHQDASLDDTKIQEILSDNKSYVKTANATSFITTKGEYEIPYSELYQSSTVIPSNPSDNFANIKSILENSSQDNVQINENGEISEIVWDWGTLNDEECELQGYYDDDDSLCSGYNGNIVNGELEDGFPIFIKSNNKIYRVTSIALGALESTNLEKITIPEGVTKIGDDVFAWCSKLTDVHLPESMVELGYGAFRQTTSLLNINLSDNIIKCGYIAFAGSKWETSQPDGPIYVGKVFYSYKGTIPQNTNLTIKEGTLCFTSPENINGNWFRSGLYDVGKLSSIIIPKSFEQIPSYCFSACSSLTSIIINKPKDSISGAPWGAPNMTADDVDWAD